MPALPGWVLEGMAPCNEGSFTCRRAVGISYTGPRLPPIEPSLRNKVVLPGIEPDLLSSEATPVKETFELFNV